MLSYRLFQFRLLFHLSALAFQNIFLSLKKRASFIVTTLLFTMIIGLLLSKLAVSPVVQVEDTVTAAPLPTYISEVEEEHLTLKEINQRLKKTEKILKEQPTHFDLLINTAFLHQALGNNEEAQAYFNQAQSVNPNHPIFE